MARRADAVPRTRWSEGLDTAASSSLGGELDARAHAELAEHVRQVRLDRASRDAQLVADHSVGPAAEQQLDDLGLGVGEARPTHPRSHGACGHDQTDVAASSSGDAPSGR